MDNDGEGAAQVAAGERVARLRRTAEDWRALLERWTGSGESPATFCQRENANICQFYAWRRRLQIAGVPSAQRAFAGNDRSGGFVEAIVLEGAPSAATQRGVSLEIVLVNGRRVRVTGGVDEELLKRVVRSLESI